MKRREVWGSALIVAAALCTWADLVISEAYGAAARKGLLLYVGIPADSIASWFLIVALLSGAVGLSLLLPALICRITKRAPRRIIGWTIVAAAAAALPCVGLIFIFTALGAFGIGDTVKVTAADGQSVLIKQDGFDGDSVDVYTEHDEFHYKQAKSAPELSGWPRVKDQDCRLESAAYVLQLRCGVRTVTLHPEGGR
ncbi:hypothetical protein ACFVWT_21055 [Arthrobacter sp. NPDC058288]|uniref:hypothetical protein n=1 Tax=Arthrobacter sp. NPDC058288 TaxID=3346424 RepID=UPI0036E31416